MYQTDLTDDQKNFIKRTIPMEKWHSKYEVFSILDAIIHVDITGCQWRNLPHEYPKWQTVYYYFRAWGANDEFTEMLAILVEQVRIWEGQSPIPAIGAIDSQSVRSALPQSEKGIDGNKKVKGIKRHIVTDKNGFVLAAYTTTANVHDSKAAYVLLALLSALYPGIKKVYADSGYRGQVGKTAMDYLDKEIEITHSHYSGSGFVPAKKRWVVERTFAWLDHFRRLCRNYEQTLSSANEMLMVAAIVMLLRRAPKFNIHY